jgi:hypothetical protein
MSIHVFHNRLKSQHGHLQSILAGVADPATRHNLLWRSHEGVLREHDQLALCVDSVLAGRLLSHASTLLALAERAAPSAALAPAPSRADRALEREVFLATRYPDLTLRLYAHRASLEAAARRSGLDPDRASTLARKVIYGYLRAAEDRVVSRTEPNKGFLKGILFRRALVDMSRHRHYLASHESQLDTQDGREIADLQDYGTRSECSGAKSAKTPAPGLAEQFVESAPENLPLFYAEWMERSGKWQPYIADLRRCCLEELGLFCYVEEWIRLRSCVFGEKDKAEGTSSGVTLGTSSRLDLQRRLRWFEEKKTSNARNAARCRVLTPLRLSWQQVWDSGEWCLGKPKQNTRAA